MNVAYYSYYYPVDSGVYYAQSSPVLSAEPVESSELAAPEDAVGEYIVAAEDAFRAQDYRRAVQLINHAIVESPGDGGLYMFLGQALFALGDFRGAAAAVHQGASLLDSKDWGLVVENFRSYYRGQTYVEQMRVLNDYIKESPDAPYAHFLRGFHYGFLGHDEAAVKDLTRAYELEPRDELAALLIERFGGSLPKPPPLPPVEDARRPVEDARPVEEASPPLVLPPPPPGK